MTSIILYTRGRFRVNQTLSWLFKDIFPPKKNNLPHLNLSTLYQACWRLHCMCQWWKHPYLERHHVVPALSVCWWSQSSQSFPPKRYINTVSQVGGDSSMNKHSRLHYDTRAEGLPSTMRWRGRAVAVVLDSMTDSTHLIIWHLWCIVLS